MKGLLLVLVAFSMASCSSVRKAQNDEEVKVVRDYSVLAIENTNR